MQSIQTYFFKLHANTQVQSPTQLNGSRAHTTKFDIDLALKIPASKPSTVISVFPKGHISLYCLTRAWGRGGEWLPGWASAKPFPGKDTRTLTSDRVVFSRYNLGMHLKGSLVPQKKGKDRLNVQFPRLDALLVLAVIRVNAEGKKLTLKELILHKRAQAPLLDLTHPAPHHLLRKLKPSTFHRAEE